MGRVFFIRFFPVFFIFTTLLLCGALPAQAASMPPCEILWQAARAEGLANVLASSAVAVPLQACTDAAHAGDAESQYRLGRVYGLGDLKNLAHSQAERDWLEQAARQGHIFAQFWRGAAELRRYSHEQKHTFTDDPLLQLSLLTLRLTAARNWFALARRQAATPGTPLRDEWNGSMESALLEKMSALVEENLALIGASDKRSARMVRFLHKSQGKSIRKFYFRPRKG